MFFVVQSDPKVQQVQLVQVQQVQQDQQAHQADPQAQQVLLVQQVTLAPQAQRVLLSPFSALWLTQVSCQELEAQATVISLTVTCMSGTT
jgi:hypothetical protein